MNINFNNIEELFFLNEKVKNLFPELKHIVDSWNMGYMHSELSFLRKKAVLDLLNSLTKDNIKVLNEIFKEEITIDKLDYNITKNYEFPVGIRGFTLNSNMPYLCITRNKDKLKITQWR